MPLAAARVLRGFTAADIGAPLPSGKRLGEHMQTSSGPYKRSLTRISPRSIFKEGDCVSSGSRFSHSLHAFVPFLRHPLTATLSTIPTIRYWLPPSNMGDDDRMMKKNPLTEESPGIAGEACPLGGKGNHSTLCKKEPRQLTSYRGYILRKLHHLLVSPRRLEALGRLQRHLQELADTTGDTFHRSARRHLHRALQHSADRAD